MTDKLKIECFLEALGNYLAAREDSDQEVMARAAAEAEERMKDAVAACLAEQVDLTRQLAEALVVVRRHVPNTKVDHDGLEIQHSAHPDFELVEAALAKAKAAGLV